MTPCLRARRHNGRMATTRIRLDLVLDGASTEDRRRWLVKIDGADVAVMTAEHRDGAVEVGIVVEEASRRRGVARTALGRLLGMSPWGSDVRYVARLSPADTAGAALATRLGFFALEEAAGATREWVRSAPRPRRDADDITRFLDAAGRIDRYPLRAEDRRALLAWVTARALPADTLLDEARVNALLEPFAPGGDVAVLRRYLVDHELVERTRSGSEYLRVE